jgi:integral membrane protein
MKLNDSLSRFRLIAIVEGWSFLFLLFIAMPLKYIAGYPMPVKIGGWIHGLLFVAFGFSLIAVWADRKWKFSKVLLAFICSLLPFGTFWFDKRIAKESN